MILIFTVSVFHFDSEQILFRIRIGKKKSVEKNWNTRHLVNTLWIAHFRNDLRCFVTTFFIRGNARGVFQSGSINSTADLLGKLPLLPPAFKRSNCKWRIFLTIPKQEKKMRYSLGIQNFTSFFSLYSFLQTTHLSAKSGFKEQMEMV